MKQLAGGRALGAVAMLLTSVLSMGTVAQAKGGVPDAPRVSGVPAVCANGGRGNVVLNQSGRRITLAVSAQDVAASPGWRITVGDTVSGVVARATTGAVSSQWTAVVNYEATKGVHTVIVDLTSIDGANRCVASLSYRV